MVQRLASRSRLGEPDSKGLPGKASAVDGKAPLFVVSQRSDADVPEDGDMAALDGRAASHSQPSRKGMRDDCGAILDCQAKIHNRSLFSRNGTRKDETGTHAQSLNHRDGMQDDRSILGSGAGAAQGNRISSKSLQGIRIVGHGPGDCKGANTKPDRRAERPLPTLRSTLNVDKVRTAQELSRTRVADRASTIHAAREIDRSCYMPKQDGTASIPLPVGEDGEGVMRGGLVSISQARISWYDAAGMASTYVVSLFDCGVSCFEM